MRESIFSIGLIFLVVGFLIFFIGFSKLNEIEQYGAMADVWMAVSPEFRQTVSEAYMMELAGGIFAIIGIGVSIYGVTTKTSLPTTKALKQIQRTSKTTNVCPHCNDGNPFDALFCRTCGEKLTGEMRGQIVCLKCGHKTWSPARFCNSCGTKMKRFDE